MSDTDLLVTADKPTQTDFQRYATGAADIQERCACIRWDPRECLEARYRRPMDEIARSTFDGLDEECECRCHDELRQLEEDVYGPRDDD